MVCLRIATELIQTQFVAIGTFLPTSPRPMYRHTHSAFMAHNTTSSRVHCLSNSFLRVLGAPFMCLKTAPGAPKLHSPTLAENATGVGFPIAKAWAAGGVVVLAKARGALIAQTHPV